jgi:hypothetical protein
MPGTTACRRDYTWCLGTRPTSRSLGRAATGPGDNDPKLLVDGLRPRAFLPSVIRHRCLLYITPWLTGSVTSATPNGPSLECDAPRPRPAP